MRLLTEAFDVQVAPDFSVPTLAREVADCAALLVRSAPIPASVIEAGASLKIISCHGVGVDKIDVAAASRRGIPVAITPYANTVSVAEHTLALMLALAKRIIEYDGATRAGKFAIRNTYQAVDLNGKLLGVLGMGRIGSMVCRKARAAFEMEVLAYDPFISAETIEQTGARPVRTIPELLKNADVLTIHVPYTSETRGLIGAAEFRQMKPGALLINTARGAIVDESALAYALNERQIAGAALDVYDPEPPDANNPLLHLSNVVLTPHSASLTAEGVVRLATQSAQAIVDIFEGRRPVAVVNPEVFG
jgi:D-3-phosphoglycerate dehydrogenase